MTVIETLAAWCAQPKRFTPQARKLAIEAITDTLACLYAGRDDFSTRAVSDAWTVPYRSPAVQALINATAAHAIDYDDNFAPGMSHASAVLVPALLAVALAERRESTAVIDAYLIGLQAQAWIGETVGRSHYTAGWHGTSTVGCIGTAAGVAWLMGLDEAGIARALSIAVSLASGVKGQFGTPLKPFHAGMAARGAVESAVLAKTGMSGRRDIIEGPQGFCELYAGQSAQQRPEHSIPTEHVIERVGLMPKKHPCCGSTHRILDAIADLQAQHRFNAEDIEQVVTKVGVANWRNLAYAQPENEMQARFSMPYCVQVMLEKGRLSVSDFTPRQVMQQADPVKLARISMVAWRAEEEQMHDNLPHSVTLHFKDGRQLTAQRHSAKGGLGERFTEDDRRQKFVDCCQGLADAASHYLQLQSLDSQADLSFLRPLLVA